jgi:predicted amidophosphoribosyltransferase
MPIKNSVGIARDSSVKNCIECGTRISKLARTCPACGETQESHKGVKNVRGCCYN